MRSAKSVIAIIIGVFLLGAFALAGRNQMGISDVYKVNFAEKVRVADTLLPSGDYEIRHVMEGSRPHYGVPAARGEEAGKFAPNARWFRCRKRQPTARRSTR